MNNQDLSFYNNILDKEAMRMFSKAYHAALRRATKKEIKFEISLEDIIEKFISQKGKCFYSNEPMLIKKENKNILHDPYKMTIDCIDSNIGYVKENVVWCLYCVNSFKQKMSPSEIIKISRNIVKNNE